MIINDSSVDENGSFVNQIPKNHDQFDGKKRIQQQHRHHYQHHNNFSSINHHSSNRNHAHTQSRNKPQKRHLQHNDVESYRLDCSQQSPNNGWQRKDEIGNYRDFQNFSGSYESRDSCLLERFDSRSNVSNMTYTLNGNFGGQIYGQNQNINETVNLQTNLPSSFRLIDQNDLYCRECGCTSNECCCHNTQSFVKMIPQKIVPIQMINAVQAQPIEQLNYFEIPPQIQHQTMSYPMPVPISTVQNVFNPIPSLSNGMVTCPQEEYRLLSGPLPSQNVPIRHQPIYYSVPYNTANPYIQENREYYIHHGTSMIDPHQIHNSVIRSDNNLNLLSSAQRPQNTFYSIPATFSNINQERSSVLQMDSINPSSRFNSSYSSGDYESYHGDANGLQSDHTTRNHAQNAPPYNWQHEERLQPQHHYPKHLVSPIQNAHAKKDFEQSPLKKRTERMHLHNDHFLRSQGTHSSGKNNPKGHKFIEVDRLNRHSRTRSSVSSARRVESTHKNDHSSRENLKRPKTSTVDMRTPFELPCRTLFCRNVAIDLKRNFLRNLFEKYGHIREFFDQHHTSRGFLFVTYYDLRHAERAYAAFQGKLLNDRPVDAHYSLPRADVDILGPCDRSKNQGSLLIKAEIDEKLLPAVAASAQSEMEEGEERDDRNERDRQEKIEKYQKEFLQLVRNSCSSYGDLRKYRLGNIHSEPKSESSDATLECTIEFYDSRAAIAACDALRGQKLGSFGPLSIEHTWDHSLSARKRYDEGLQKFRESSNKPDNKVEPHTATLEAQKVIIGISNENSTSESSVSIQESDKNIESCPFVIDKTPKNAGNDIPAPVDSALILEDREEELPKSPSPLSAVATLENSLIGPPLSCNSPSIDDKRGAGTADPSKSTPADATENVQRPSSMSIIPSMEAVQQLAQLLLQKSSATSPGRKF